MGEHNKPRQTWCILYPNKKAYRWDLQETDIKTAINFGFGENSYPHKQGRTIAN